jgi:hypothetical protein
VAVLAVGREVDGIARALESRAQLPPEIGFVFDDQNAHCINPLEPFALSTRAELNGCLSGTTGEGARKVNRGRRAD